MSRKTGLNLDEIHNQDFISSLTITEEKMMKGGYSEDKNGIILEGIVLGGNASNDVDGIVMKGIVM